MKANENAETQAHVLKTILRNDNIQNICMKNDLNTIKKKKQYLNSKQKGFNVGLYNFLNKLVKVQV